MSSILPPHIFSLDEAEEASLRAIANSGEPAADAAQVYLELIFGEPVEFPYEDVAETARLANPFTLPSAPWATIYPNPAQNDLLIQLTEDVFPVHLQLLDIQGRVVLQQLLTQAENKLSVSHLAAGLYVCELRSQLAGIHQQKIIIRR